MMIYVAHPYGEDGKIKGIKIYDEKDVFENWKF